MDYDLIVMFTMLGLVFLIGLLMMSRDKIYEDRSTQYKLTQQDLLDIELSIKNMSPRRFEYFCEDLYKTLGYNSSVTQATADGGKDVILKHKGKTIYVECKHYFECNTIGRPIAQKLYGALMADKADKGIIFTTGQFTKDCLEYCKKVNIECVGLRDIIDMCRRIGTGKALKIAGVDREMETYLKKIGVHN